MYTTIIPSHLYIIVNINSYFAFQSLQQNSFIKSSTYTFSTVFIANLLLLLPLFSVLMTKCENAVRTAGPATSLENWYPRQIEIDAESGWISIYVSLTTPSSYICTEISAIIYPRCAVRTDTRHTTRFARGLQPHQFSFQPPTLFHERAHMHNLCEEFRPRSCTLYYGRVSGFQPAEIRTRPTIRFDSRPLPVRRVSHSRYENVDDRSRKIWLLQVGWGWVWLRLLSDVLAMVSWKLSINRFVGRTCLCIAITHENIQTSAGILHK